MQLLHACTSAAFRYNHEATATTTIICCAYLYAGWGKGWWQGGKKLGGCETVAHGCHERLNCETFVGFSRASSKSWSICARELCSGVRQGLLGQGLLSVGESCILIRGSPASAASDAACASFTAPTKKMKARRLGGSASNGNPPAEPGPNLQVPMLIIPGHSRNRPKKRTTPGTNRRGIARFRPRCRLGTEP